MTDIRSCRRNYMGYEGKFERSMIDWCYDNLLDVNNCRIAHIHLRSFKEAHQRKEAELRKWRKIAEELVQK